MTHHTFSLWLTPAGAAGDALATLIADLADQHDSPRFPPHITLLGSLFGDEAEIVRLAGEIAVQTPPLHVDFEGLGMEDVFFRALYLVARKAPDLMAINARARQIFASDRPEPFMPHLSLFYGDAPAEAKRAIGEANLARLTASCEVVNLDVYTTEPPVESWRLARRFALEGPDR